MTEGVLWLVAFAILGIAVAALAFRLADLDKRFNWRCAYCDQFHDSLRADARIRNSVFTRLEAKAGDTVVMECPVPLRAEAWDRVRERLTEEMHRHGLNVKVLLLDSGWKFQCVLSRPPADGNLDGPKN